MTPDILAAMGPLPFPCYSWPLPDEEIFTTTDMQPLAVLINWARVTHSVSLRGETCGEIEVSVAAEACRQVNRFNPAIPATIALNFSPYQDATYDPTETGQLWIDHVIEFYGKLLRIIVWAGNVQVSAVLLDHERWKVADGPPETGDGAWRSSIDEKYNTFYNIAKYVFPDASVYLYGRGVTGQRLTGNERGDGTSTPLYHPDDLPKTLDWIRGHRNSTSRQERYGDKISWWLACGWSRNAFDGTLPPAERILPIDIPLNNMRLIGAAVAERAPHEPVMLYPSPWDTRLTNAWEIVAPFAEGAGS